MQPGQIKTAIDSTKVAALQAKIADDETLMDSLSADPKAFLAKEGITLPADQQVKVLEVGEKIYLVLDDRSLQLLHPELNKATDLQNEVSKKLASIRTKAASDSAFKAELLKNTAQTLIKEGVSEDIAGQFEVIDYQPNVNLLIVASEGAEINRGAADDEWNFDLWKVTLNGKSLPLPMGFKPLAKKLINDHLQNNYFNFLTNSEKSNVLNKIEEKFGYGVTGSCAATGTLINIDFCVAYIKQAVNNELKGTLESPSKTVKAAFETVLTKPENYPKSIITNVFKNKITPIQKEYDAIKKLQNEEVKTPSQKLSDEIAMRWQIVDLKVYGLLKLEKYLIPSGDITKMIGILNSYRKEIHEDLTKRGVFG